VEVFKEKSGKEWIQDRIKILCPIEEDMTRLKKAVRELGVCGGYLHLQWERILTPVHNRHKSTRFVLESHI
jgi:hypothetical protein